jgi:hypothetical protein
LVFTSWALDFFLLRCWLSGNLGLLFFEGI